MSFPKPIVSVVLPTYRRPELLRRAIRSVLAQSHADFELLVVDDASGDETPQVVAGFKDPRIRYLRQMRNAGAAAARNLAIAEARGEFLAFQDDDDIWLRDRLAVQLDALCAAGPAYGLSLAGYICLTRHGPRYVGGPSAFARIDFSRGVRGDFGLSATPCWLVRTELVRQAGGFDERLRTWEDWELALRLSQRCRLMHVEQPLFIQDRRRGGALWRMEGAFADSMRIVHAKHGSLWAHDMRIVSHHHFIIGKSECQFGSPAEGRRALFRALVAWPLNLKALVLLIGSCLGAQRLQSSLRIFREGRRRLQTTLRWARS